MDHEFRRSLLNVVANMEGLCDAKKEMCVVKSEQAKGLTLERKEEEEEKTKNEKMKQTAYDTATTAFKGLLVLLH